MNALSKSLLIVGCVALLAFAGQVAATPISEASYLTVEQPLDVGGTVLQPGVYVIKVVPSDSNRNFLQVTSEDGKSIIATVLSVPHALPATEEMVDTKYVFYPATSSEPRALRTWYAPDSTSEGGHDIVYPERRAMELASVAKAPVVAFKGESPGTSVSEARLETVTPERTIAEYVDRAPVQTASQETSARNDEQEMPRTAGSTPLLALLGLASLGGALAFRGIRSA